LAGCWRRRVRRPIAWLPMRTPARPKCLQCNEEFVADRRNQWHQRYCRKPGCRHASKADSQRRWTHKPGNENYFSGAENTERVRVWRLANPGYRRRKRSAPESVLQDVLKPQVAANEIVTPPQPRSVLQEICFMQPAMLVGLISIMTGHGQQEDIATSARLFVTRGEDILRMTPGSPAFPNHENQNTPVPRTLAARAPPV
jgi:hypothetical protein